VIFPGKRVMTEIDDIWINAFGAFPDVQPLVRLLRSDVPITPGARDLFAELLSPGDPPISDFELVPKAGQEVRYDVGAARKGRDLRSKTGRWTIGASRRRRSR